MAFLRHLRCTRGFPEEEVHCIKGKGATPKAELDEEESIKLIGPLHDSKLKKPFDEIAPEMLLKFLDSYTGTMKVKLSFKDQIFLVEMKKMKRGRRGWFMGGFDEKETGDLNILPPRDISTHKILTIYDVQDGILLEPERSLLQDEKHEVDPVL